MRDAPARPTTWAVRGGVALKRVPAPLDPALTREAERIARFSRIVREPVRLVAVSR